MPTWYHDGVLVIREVPPAIVLAFMGQLLWIPQRLVFYALDAHGTAVAAVSTAVALLSTALIIHGALAVRDISRRSTGIALGCAWVVQLTAIAMHLAISTAWAIDNTWTQAAQPAYLYARGGLYLIAFVAFAIASRRWSLGLVLVLCAAAVQVPWKEWTGLRADVSYLLLGAMILQQVFAMLAVSAANLRAEPPTFDHLRASRRLSRAAWCFAIAAVLFVVQPIVVATASSELAVEYVAGARVLVFATAAWEIGRVAISQFPQLSLYALHVAAVLAMTSAWLGYERMMIEIWRVHMDYWSSRPQTMFWPELALPIAALAIAFAARHYRIRAWKLCVPVIVIAAAIGGYFHTTNVPYAASFAVITSVAAGLLRNIAAKLAGDPVKTTADVFA
ncbi:MAG: hypothetical protein QM831_29420 [Kofleriaceae bacterium]